jgi:hypothetical protein
VIFGIKQNKIFKSQEEQEELIFYVYILYLLQIKETFCSFTKVANFQERNKEEFYRIHIV